MKGLENLAAGRKRSKVVAFIKDGDAVLSKQEIDTIEKELKALEIIKEHWNFEGLKSGFGSKGLVQIKPISMEDANLLIEVLL